MTSKEEFDRIIETLESLAKADRTAVAVSEAFEDLLRIQQAEITDLTAHVVSLTTRVAALEIMENFNDIPSRSGQA